MEVTNRSQSECLTQKDRQQMTGGKCKSTVIQKKYKSVCAKSHENQMSLTMAPFKQSSESDHPRASFAIIT